MRKIQLTIAMAMVAIGMSPAFAETLLDDTLLDPLHGFCSGVTCTDNGINTQQAAIP